MILLLQELHHKLLERQNPADLYLATSGNVGIGVTSPSYTLHVKAASGSTTGLRLESSGGTTNFDILSSEGDGNAYLYQRSNYGILIGTNNALRMTITAGFCLPEKAKGL